MRHKATRDLREAERIGGKLAMAFDMQSPQLGRMAAELYEHNPICALGLVSFTDWSIVGKDATFMGTGYRGSRGGLRGRWRRGRLAANR